jgi:hypothetical protein
MPVSAMHDDDLIYFDLIQVTKPSTGAILLRVTALHRDKFASKSAAAFINKGGRARSPFGEIETRRNHLRHKE